MAYSFILGGTRGLGLALAEESRKIGVIPIITGRSANRASNIRDAEEIIIDLTDERTFQELEKIRSYDIQFFFWVAGVFLRKEIVEMTNEEIEKMIRTHLWGAIRVLQSFHRMQKKPYHLITIASTSSWRLRQNETLYCALKAAKAAFTRNFALEIFKDLPGSKVTLINPGGMRTPGFWKETDQDISKFMDPEEVAKKIWVEVQNQTDSFQEIQMPRDDEGHPAIGYDSRLPEIPT